MSHSEELRRIVVVGHVDHGKSTLLARVMLDLGCIPEDKIEKVQNYCKDKGSNFEPAFLLDAFSEEQEQGVSIETTRIKFEFQGEQYLLIDAPGHLEFLRNMTTGASDADTALLVVDCRHGIRSQTERHLKVLKILGVTNVVVAMNKMDEVGYEEEAFKNLSQNIYDLITSDDLVCQAVVPVSAYYGENISSLSSKLAWYKGQPLLNTLVEVFEDKAKEEAEKQPFRMVLQDVYRFENKRHFAGRVVSGEVKTGATILFSPSGKISTIESIEKYPNKVDSAGKSESIALELSEQIFVERGEIISFPDDAPEIDHEIRGRAVWLSAEPFLPGGKYIVKIGTAESEAVVDVLDDHGELEDPTQLEPISNGAFMDVLIRSFTPLAFDKGVGSAETKCFVLCTNLGTVAAGSIDYRSRIIAAKLVQKRNITAEKGYTQRSQYEAANKHKGTVLWLTGLPGAGKSTLAKSLEQRLFQDNYKVVALDADNLRSGLSADLGFTPKDRSENIRRIGQVAKLFLETGNIVIVACISPSSADREEVRSIVGSTDFFEVFVSCPLETCQDRDPKGLYRQANNGKLKAMTGVSSSYQPPRQPALKLDTNKMTIEDEVQAVIHLLQNENIISKSSTLPATSISG